MELKNTTTLKVSVDSEFTEILESIADCVHGQQKYFRLHQVFKQIDDTTYEVLNIRNAPQIMLNNTIEQRALKVLDMYLSAGCKDSVEDATKAAKKVWKDYYGKTYINK